MVTWSFIFTVLLLTLAFAWFPAGASLLAALLLFQFKGGAVFAGAFLILGSILAVRSFKLWMADRTGNRED